MSLSVHGEYFSPPHKHTKDSLTCGEEETTLWSTADPLDHLSCDPTMKKHLSLEGLDSISSNIKSFEATCSTNKTLHCYYNSLASCSYTLKVLANRPLLGQLLLNYFLVNSIAIFMLKD